jgi:hypothetical protein
MPFVSVTRLRVLAMRVRAPDPVAWRGAPGRAGRPEANALQREAGGGRRSGPGSWFRVPRVGTAFSTPEVGGAPLPEPSRVRVGGRRHLRSTSPDTASWSCRANSLNPPIGQVDFAKSFHCSLKKCPGIRVCRPDCDSTCVYNELVDKCLEIHAYRGSACVCATTAHTFINVSRSFDPRERREIGEMVRTTRLERAT